MDLLYYKLKHKEHLCPHQLNEYSDICSKGFQIEKDYLMIDKHINNCLIKLLNDDKELVIVSKDLFLRSTEIMKHKTLTYIYIKNDWLLEPNKNYDIYRIKESNNNSYYQEYYVLNDKFDFVWIPNICFSNNNESINIFDITTKLKNLKSKNDKSELYEIIIKLLLSKNYDLNNLNNVSFKDFIKKKYLKSNQIDIFEYKRIEKFNQLSYELLGKIKYIENSLFLSKKRQNTPILFRWGI